MTKFKIVAVSKDSQQKISNEMIASVADHVQFIQINDNKEPITKIYNHYLSKTRAARDADILIFMHADVSMDIVHLLQSIDSCKDKYDVIGLCGTATFNVSQSPLNWFTGSNPTPASRWGCVTHGEVGNQTSFFSQHSPNVTDHEVACIDGLCIAFCPKALQSDICFDEQFLFDFYDTDISMQAVMKYNFKLGVVVEKSLQHYSIGKSILTRDFLMHELDFRSKWKLEIPKQSPINQMLANMKQQRVSNI